MKRTPILVALLAATALVNVQNSRAGQAPGAANAPDIAISHKDRFYTSDQFSNTVSVIDPVDNKLLGVLRLGDTTPANLSPLYKGQLLVHGMGFSPDHRTLATVSIGSNSVTFIDLATNAIKHVTYVGRSPHEAFFTPNGEEVWVTVRGEDYVASKMQMRPPPSTHWRTKSSQRFQSDKRRKVSHMFPTQCRRAMGCRICSRLASPHNRFNWYWSVRTQSPQRKSPYSTKA